MPISKCIRYVGHGNQLSTALAVVAARYQAFRSIKTDGLLALKSVVVRDHCNANNECREGQRGLKLPGLAA